MARAKEANKFTFHNVSINSPAHKEKDSFW